MHRWLTLLAIIFCSIGLALFLHGFFLTRRELGVISKRIPEIEHNHINEISSSSKKYNRFFLFIIDALRSDFLTYHDGESCNGKPLNCFPHLHNLMLHNSTQSRIFTLRNEPPTVTAQRLKALTTGTLPTFIDIGSNLNSSAVTEDNLIDQFLTHANLSHKHTDCMEDKSFAVLGDDTWKALFPSQFDYYRMFDSFNTKDLDTVDNGILHYLWDFLPIKVSTQNLTAPISSSQCGWKVLIAHFLGVDHIGHTHHAFHPLMANRLQHMDMILQQVIERLPEDALLLVLGDHGMTNEGEHGGASDHEIDAGLFVYSHLPIFPSLSVEQGSQRYVKRYHKNVWNESNEISGDENQDNVTSNPLFDLMRYPKIIRQIDLVPTLALLFDIPIPFSSIGKVIPEFFLQHHQSELSTALLRNALQVWRYLMVFYDLMDLNTWTLSGDHLIDCAENDVLCLVTKLQIILSEMQTIALEKKTMPAELKALQTMLVDGLQHHIQQLQKQYQSVDATEREAITFEINTKYFQYLSSVQAFCRSKWAQYHYPTMILGILVCAFALSFSGWIIFFATNITDITINNSTLYQQLYQSQSLLLKDCLVLVAVFSLLLFEGLSVFSNSFIIEEVWVNFFGWQTVLLLTVGCCFLWRQKKTIINTADDDDNKKNIKKNYFQYNIFWLVVTLILNRLLWNYFSMENSNDNNNITISKKNEENNSINNMTLPWLFATICVYLAYHYLLHYHYHGSKATNLSSSTQQTFFQASYAITQLLFWIQFLMRTGYYNNDNNDDVLHVLMPQYCAYLAAMNLIVLIVLRWLSSLLHTVLLPTWSDDNNHIVCNFVTLLCIYSFPQHVMFIYVCLIVILMFLLVCAELCLSVQTFSRKYILFTIVTVGVKWWGKFLFNITGHRVQMNTLQLSVAFIGKSEFNFWYGGSALSVNTFASTILEVMMLNLFLSNLENNNINRERRVALLRKPTLKVEEPQIALTPLIDELLEEKQIIFSFYWFNRIFVMVCSCVSLLILRHHLMVWAIFAPKFLFEVAFWGFSSLLFFFCYY